MVSKQAVVIGFNIGHLLAGPIAPNSVPSNTVIVQAYLTKSKTAPKLLVTLYFVKTICVESCPISVTVVKVVLSSLDFTGYILNVTRRSFSDIFLWFFSGSSKARFPHRP